MDPAVDAIKEKLDVPVNAWMASCGGVGVLALIVAWIVAARLARRQEGSDEMQRAGRAIRVGVRAFVRAHLATVALVALAVAAALFAMKAAHGGGGTTAAAFG